MKIFWCLIFVATIIGFLIWALIDKGNQVFFTPPLSYFWLGIILIAVITLIWAFLTNSLENWSDEFVNSFRKKD